VTTPPGTMDLIRKLWQQGNSTRQIAAKARISQSTASRYVRRFEELKQAAEPPDGEAASPIDGPVVMLICMRCWSRYLAPAQRVADLFCPQCTE
jgi:transposase